MLPDRMMAYEAPRSTVPSRGMRNVTLRFPSKTVGGSLHVVQIPADMNLPDLIKYRGHTFVHRCDDIYSMATVWPIMEELDG